MNKEIDDVKDFWENNPLFSGESSFTPGSREFFNEHTQVYLGDVFAGHYNSSDFIPNIPKSSKVLDLGCGVGFWVIELGQKGKFENLYAADLTENALKITKKRAELFNIDVELSQQNAESTTFEDKFFDHINCQGVIHHTPNTEQTIFEMHRILNNDGTASISVYYKNFFLRNWKFFRFFGSLFYRIGAKLRGRGREEIFNLEDTNDITRLYDGDKNPIGKSYSKKEAMKLVEKYFIIERVYLNFFPARSLPFKLPRSTHYFLSRNFGFLIHLDLKKKN